MPAFVNTELASGTTELKGVKRSTPEDVAEAVVDALQYGRFEVYVPKSLGRPRPLDGAHAAAFARVARAQDGRPGAAEGRQERPRGLRGARREERAGRRGGRRRVRRRRRAEDARRRLALEPSQSAIAAPIAGPGPPAGSAPPRRSGGARAARARWRTPRRPAAGAPGPGRPTASAPGARRRAAPRARRRPSAAPGRVGRLRDQAAGTRARPPSRRAGNGAS